MLLTIGPAFSICGGGQQAGAGGMCGAPAAAKQMTECSRTPRTAGTTAVRHGYVSLLQEHGKHGRDES
ncbi:MAG: hypothetical protein Q7N95_02885 [Alphaproteobacteria bacterium]|nr:hypothetical protein [Alphaproteobacteria bacterium]